MLKDSVKRRRNWQIKDQSRKIVLRPVHKAELPFRPEEGKPEIGCHGTRKVRIQCPIEKEVSQV